MREWLLTCSTDSFEDDFEITLYSDSEPDQDACESIARSHGCSLWSLLEVA